MCVAGRVLSAVAVQRVAGRQCAGRDDFGSVLPAANCVVLAGPIRRPARLSFRARAPFARRREHAVRLLTLWAKERSGLDGRSNLCT